MVEERTLKFMFMDTSTLDAKANAYVELCRDEMLTKKQMLMRQMMMGGGMGGGTWEMPWVVPWVVPWVGT